jgi:FKBP-type peptidyl-prolyl cis-trans isomerase 2
LKGVSSRDFPKDAKLEPGSVFEAKSPTGEPLRLKIVTTASDRVNVRLLHPLAGRDLVFRVKVLTVSDPSRPPPAPGVVEIDGDDLKEA